MSDGMKEGFADTYRRFRKLTLLVKLLLKLAKDSVPACGSCCSEKSTERKRNRRRRLLPEVYTHSFNNINSGKERT